MLVIGVWLAPDASFMDEPAPDADVLALVGPLTARYEPTGDQTLVVPSCGHGQCDRGLLLSGNLSRLDGGGGVIVRADAEDWLLVDVAPMDHQYLAGPPKTTASAFAGPFELLPTWPGLGVLAIGVWIVPTGISALVAPVKPRPLVIGALLAAMGTWAGLEGSFGTVVLGAIMMIAFLCIAAFPSRLRPFAMGIACAGASMTGAAIAAELYMPSGPMI